MAFKNKLKSLNEGFKSSLRAAALATALGTSSAAGAIAAAPVDPEFARQMQQTQQYQAPEQPQEVAVAPQSKADETPDTIEKHMEELKAFIQSNEGRKNAVYKDTKGHPTVGVGFNLDRGDSKSICKQLGINYKQLRSGHVKLTDAQVDEILEHDIATAMATARKLVPNFNDQPLKMQAVLTDMSFNMGEGTLSDFGRFLTAVENKDYNTAIKSMRHSEWYHQVGDRSKKLINLVASIDNRQLREDEIEALPQE